MFGSSLPLLGILVGTFSTLQSPAIPLTKKLVPAIIALLVMANIDWTDGDFYVFWGSAMVMNWIFQNDIPNRLVDSMMRSSQDAIEAAADKVKEKIVQVGRVDD